MSLCDVRMEIDNNEMLFCVDTAYNSVINNFHANVIDILLLPFIFIPVMRIRRRQSNQCQYINSLYRRDIDER